MSGGAVTRVVAVGLGAIGEAALRRCLASHRFAMVAAVDPRRAGESVGDVEVAGALEDLPEVDADVALVATGSSLERVADLAVAVLDRGLHVVSTCEQLAYPWRREPQRSDELDRHARAAGRVVVGCGVNPGFVMDVLPALLTSACLDPTSILVTRRADLGRRRPQLRDKLGVGRPADDWHAHATEQPLGHVGLVESACLCALGAGWELPDEVAFDRSPIVGDDGRVTGVREVADLDAGGGRHVRLELEFEVGRGDEDRIDIDGSPPVHMVVEGGLQGDDATVARMLHTARVAPTLVPGLRLPLDLTVGAR